MFKHSNLELVRKITSLAKKDLVSNIFAKQYSRSVTLRGGSGSLDPCTGLRIRILLFSVKWLLRCQQKISFFTTGKFLCVFLTQANLQESLKITSHEENTKQFDSFFQFSACWLKDPDTYKHKYRTYGSGSLRPKNIQILRIQIHNTAAKEI